MADAIRRHAPPPHLYSRFASLTVSLNSAVSFLLLCNSLRVASAMSFSIAGSKTRKVTEAPVVNFFSGALLESLRVGTEVGAVHGFRAGEDFDDADDGCDFHEGYDFDLQSGLYMARTEDVGKIQCGNADCIRHAVC